MTTADVELLFEGDSVRSGSIDARLLAESLTAYSIVFQRANEIVNGDRSNAAVRVRATLKAGSLGVPLELIQDLLEQGQTLLGFDYKTALQLAILVGLIWHKDSLMALLKSLKGKKPEKVVKVEGGFQFEFAGQKKIVNNYVTNMYGDEAIRAGLAQGVEPLRQPGIERISFRTKQGTPTVITKDEASYFETEPLELTTDVLPQQGVRDAVLTISKLAFIEGNKWSFLEGGETITADIEDQHFFEKVHTRRVKFGDGDQLKVRLRWKLAVRGRRIVPENAIEKVYKVIPRPKQMRLDGTADETGAGLDG